MKVTQMLTAAAGAAVLAAVTVAPANAAWTKTWDLDGAHTYICKVNHGDKATLRMRVDARKASQWVGEELFVLNKDNQRVGHLVVKAKAHKRSKVKSITVSRRQKLANGVLDKRGDMGGAIALPDIKKC